MDTVNSFHWWADMQHKPYRHRSMNHLSHLCLTYIPTAASHEERAGPTCVIYSPSRLTISYYRLLDFWTKYLGCWTTSLIQRQNSRCTYNKCISVRRLGRLLLWHLGLLYLKARVQSVMFQRPAEAAAQQWQALAADGWSSYRGRTASI